MRAPGGYDLLERQWLLARGVDGRTVELSLVEVFRRADRLSGLAGDVPTQVFALTRLLLAVVHGALRDRLSEDTWEDMWQRKALPVDDIEKYLDEHRDRFDLFHPVTPFFQVADLHTAKNEVSELSRLVADVPNGLPFFSNRMDKNLRLSFAEAARWLVHCHAFDPSGIKSGAVGDDRVKGGKGYPIGTGWAGYLGGVLPEGSTLLETLLLNMIPNEAADGLPAWERPPLGPKDEERAPDGPVDLFTWQSRRVRLVRSDDQVVGVLICNGSRITPQNKHTMETHTAWRRSQAQEKKLGKPTVYMPLEHDPERLVWRGLQAMLPSAETSAQGKDAAARLAPEVLRWIASLTYDRTIPKDYPLRLRTIGMTYGSQSSTTAEIIDDSLALQAILLDQGAGELRQAVLSCVSAAEAAAAALGKLAANLAEAAGGSGSSDGHRDRAVELAYAELDPLFREWLAQLGPTTDHSDCRGEWHSLAFRAIRDLGNALLADASPTAWVGRMVRNRWISSTHADGWFHRELRAALPLAKQLVSAGKGTS